MGKKQKNKTKQMKSFGITALGLAMVCIDGASARWTEKTHYMLGCKFSSADAGGPEYGKVSFNQKYPDVHNGETLTSVEASISLSNLD